MKVLTQFWLYSNTKSNSVFCTLLCINMFRTINNVEYNFKYLNISRYV